MPSKFDNNFRFVEMPKSHEELAVYLQNHSKLIEDSGAAGRSVQIPTVCVPALPEWFPPISMLKYYHCTGAIPWMEELMRNHGLEKASITVCAQYLADRSVPCTAAIDYDGTTGEAEVTVIMAEIIVHITKNKVTEGHLPPRTFRPYYEQSYRAPQIAVLAK